MLNVVRKYLKFTSENKNLINEYNVYVNEYNEISILERIDY